MMTDGQKMAFGALLYAVDNYNAHVKAGDSLPWDIHRVELAALSLVNRMLEAREKEVT